MLRKNPNEIVAGSLSMTVKKQFLRYFKVQLSNFFQVAHE